MQTSEPAEYALLGQLITHPMHGYEMFQQFQKGILGHIVHLEMSQMYAFLKKLEQLSYIEATIESQGSKPPRKIFHITEKGRDLFLQWLQQAVQRPRDIRILFLLKLYFISRIRPEQTTHLLELQIQACEEFLEHLLVQKKQSAEIISSDTGFFDHVVLSSRIHQTQALLNWMKELQENSDLLKPG